MEIKNIVSNMKFQVFFSGLLCNFRVLIYLVKNVKFLRMENYVSNMACKCSFFRQIMKGKSKP